MREWCNLQKGLHCLQFNSTNPDHYIALIPWCF